MCVKVCNEIIEIPIKSQYLEITKQWVIDGIPNKEHNLGDVKPIV